MPVDTRTSTTMYKTTAVLIISVIAVANCHDLVAGHRLDGRKIFDEKFEASPAIWRQDNNVTVNTTEGEVISRIVVTDLRETKDADVQIVNGNIGDKSVTIELKSPTVFRGYEFKIEIYALPEGADNLGRTDSPIPPALSGNLQPGTRIEDNGKLTTENAHNKYESQSNLPRTNVDSDPGDLEKELRGTSDAVTDSTVEMPSTTPVNQLRKGRETQDDTKNYRDLSKDTPSSSEHPRNLGETQPSNNLPFGSTETAYTNANTQKDKEDELYSTTTTKTARNGRETVAKENNTDESIKNINTNKPTSLKDMENAHTIKMRDTSSKDSKYPGQSSTTESDHAFNPTVIPLNQNNSVLKDNKQSTTVKYTNEEKDDDDVKSTRLLNMDSDDKFAASTVKNDVINHPRQFRDTQNDKPRDLTATVKDSEADNSHSTESGINVTPYVYIHRATEADDKTTNPQKAAANKPLKPIISLQ